MIHIGGGGKKKAVPVPFWLFRLLCAQMEDAVSEGGGSRSALLGNTILRQNVLCGIGGGGGMLSFVTMQKGGGFTRASP